MSGVTVITGGAGYIGAATTEELLKSGRKVRVLDVLLHGHIHYGPGHGQIGRVATWRTGSFVSPGHLGSSDRMLRYRDGRFERIGWDGARWTAFGDGR